MKSYIQNIFDMYNRLDQDDSLNLSVSDTELNALLQLKECDIYDLNKFCDDYSIGALIVLQCKNGPNEFCRIMDILINNIPENIFNYIIDYDGKLSDGRNPIDAVGNDLPMVLYIIYKYYDKKFFMLYELMSYGIYPTLTHFIIGNDKKNGKQRILNALNKYKYTKEQFDTQVLDDIWEEYYE